MENRRLYEHANRSIEFMGIITGLPVKLLTESEYELIELETAYLTCDELDRR